VIFGIWHLFIEVADALKSVASHQHAMGLANLRFASRQGDIAHLLALMQEVAIREATGAKGAVEESVEIVGEIATPMVDFGVQWRSLANQGLNDFSARLFGALNQGGEPVVCNEDIVFHEHHVFRVSHVMAAVARLRGAQIVVDPVICETLLGAYASQFGRDAFGAASIDIDEVIRRPSCRYDRI
jgi:hypothetical protein